MAASECLRCALARQNVCGYDYTLLRRMFAASEKEERRSEIHVTDLTGCLRRAYYDKTQPQPEYVHETLARWLGTAVHASAEGSDEHLDSELPLSFEGIVGKADVVYKDGLVLDFKTSRWLYPAKLPYGSHEAQLNLYAWLLRKQGREVNRLQIQYIDLSGPSKCRRCKVPVRMFQGPDGTTEIKCPSCFQFVPGAHLGAVLVDIPLWGEREVEALVVERKETLEKALVFGTLPAAEAGYLCNYCSHREICEAALLEA
jgi:CRISPR/Cas system-associated exonuclease Cas4 (RecB family)